MTNKLTERRLANIEETTAQLARKIERIERILAEHGLVPEDERGTVTHQEALKDPKLMDRFIREWLKRKRAEKGGQGNTAAVKKSPPGPLGRPRKGF